MVAVADDEGERGAERRPVPETGQDLDLVRFQLLARAAAVAFAPAPQVVVDLGSLELEPRGEPGHDRDERRPVRLPGGDEPQMHAASVVPP